MKAIALLSGGLDSNIAVKLIHDMGIEIIAVNFSSPFCCCNKKGSCAVEAKKITDSLNLPLLRISMAQDYLDIIKNPKYGYGKNVNPCIDCRILMHKKVKEMMKEQGASFIVTGEVLGQRPMSQFKKAMNLIEKESDLEGLVLRPLSAKLLEPTIPEKLGWVDREKLLSIQGRSRKPQIQLAKELDIKDYPCPAGGCLLTNPGFANKIRDLIKYDQLTLKNCLLLRTGRHFRIDEKSKLVVGRNEQENKVLDNFIKNNKYVSVFPVNAAGPTSLFTGEKNEENIKLCCSISARYCDDIEDLYSIIVKDTENNDLYKNVSPIDDTELKEKYMIF